MTFQSIDGRMALLLCDAPQCETTSDMFVARTGAEQAPDGWVETRVYDTPGEGVAHLCPEHAGVEPNGSPAP